VANREEKRRQAGTMDKIYGGWVTYKVVLRGWRRVDEGWA